MCSSSPATLTTLGSWFDLGEEFVDQFAGVAVSRPGVRNSGELYTGQYASARMAINLSLSEEYSDDPVSIMRHELVHAVTARAEGSGDYQVNPARWAVEGFARFIEIEVSDARRRQEHAWAAQDFAGQLPVTETFYDGDNRTVSANYALGFTVFEYIRQSHGREDAIEFYAQVIRYGDTGFGEVSTPFVETPAFDGICQRVLGITSADLLQQWGTFTQRGA